MINHLEPFIDKVGRHALQEIQLRKFQIMLDRILTHNAFYQKKYAEAGITCSADIKSAENFHRLPYTTKQDLVQDQANYPPYGSNLTFPLELYTKIHQTSGTTGEPLRCLDTRESWQWWAECWASVYRAAGVTPADRIFFAFSFGPFIGFWSAYAGAQRIGALALPGGGMSSLQRLRFMISNEVTVLVCTPTYALHLAEVADQEGINIAESGIRVTIHAGEPGASLPSTKELIERSWGARCCDHAGATEVGAWGFEHVKYGDFHVNEGEFIAEVVDEEGHHANEGELVLTNLGRIGMPVIRYKTGDRVALDYSHTENPCKFMRLKGGVIGRIDDALIVRGINIFPSAIENIVRRFSEVGEFAVDVYRKGTMDEMILRVEITGSEIEMVAKAINKELRNGLGLRVQLEAVAHGTLPRFDLKARRFTDHRKLEIAVDQR